MDDLQQRRAVYPRVSDIIRKQNEAEFRGIPLETLANACIRGQKVHDYCTAWARNLWVGDVEEEYKAYFDAFAEWAEVNVSDVLHSSVRLYDDTKRFTGEFDMIVRMKVSKKIVLMDIKTSSSPSISWPIQLSAYGHLCKTNGYHFDEIMNVHLKKTHAALYEKKEGKRVKVSSPQVRVNTIKHENVNFFWDIFSSALKCYDYFERKEGENVCV
jgi:hypothetical protein